ncbi:g3208 [Coccomyxa elongata]
MGAIVPLVAPLLTQLDRSATTPGAQGASDLSTAAPSPSAGLKVDDHGASSASDQDAAAQNALSNNSSAAPPAQVRNTGSSTNLSASAAARTATVPSPAADAHAPATPDHAANPNASPAASPSASGAAETPASPSPSLLSLLPDIMQVLNSEGQAGENGRSLNITVSAAATSPNASTDEAPALTGNLANATVESSPRRVDVQVTVNPVINVHGDILNVSSDQLQAAQVNAVPLPLGSIIPRPQINQTPDDPSPPQPAPSPDPAPAFWDDQDAGSAATAPAAAASMPPPHVVQFYAEEAPPPKPSDSAAPAPSRLLGGVAAGHVPSELAQARILSSSPAPQSDVILVPPAAPQGGSQPQVAGLLVQPQPGSNDVGSGGQPQFAFLPPKPPALPVNSTVPLQVVGSLLAALSNSQQSPTAPVATAPQLAGTGPSATSPLPQGAPVLDDPQIADALDALLDARESPQGAPPAPGRGSLLFPSPAARQGQPASAGSSSKHYPFDWAVVIAAVSSTATFMLLIVLLLAFASGFLPHRRRRGTPGSPKSLKSAPLAPSGGLTPQGQFPQVAAAGRRLSRKPSSKSIGFLGHRLSSWTRPRLEAVSVAATTGRSLGRQVSFAAPPSGPMPLRSPFADPAVVPGAQSLPRSLSGAESAAPPEQAEMAQPQPDQAHRGDFPLPIVSPFANAAAPALPTPHVRETAKISPRNRKSDDAALQQSGGEPSSPNSDAEQLSGNYPKNQWSPGARPPPMQTPFANSVLPAFSSVSTGFSDGYTTATGSPTSGSSSLETQKRLSMIIQQAL